MESLNPGLARERDLVSKTNKQAKRETTTKGQAWWHQPRISSTVEVKGVG